LVDAVGDPFVVEEVGHPGAGGASVGLRVDVLSVKVGSGTLTAALVPRWPDPANFRRPPRLPHANAQQEPGINNGVGADKRRNTTGSSRQEEGREAAPEPFRRG
jgi:hypothetical protein